MIWIYRIEIESVGRHARCNSEQILNPRVEPDAVSIRPGLLALTQTSSHGKPDSVIKT